MLEKYDGKSLVYAGRACAICGCTKKINKRGCHDCYMSGISDRAKLERENALNREKAKLTGKKTYVSAYKCKECESENLIIRSQKKGDNLEKHHQKSWLRYTVNGACAGCVTVAQHSKKLKSISPFPKLSYEERLMAGLIL